MGKRISESPDAKSKRQRSVSPPKQGKKRIIEEPSSKKPVAITALPSPENFRAEHSITVTGVSPVPAPWLTFDLTEFADVLKNGLIAAKYTAPTPTQAQSWPVVSTGRDLISIAKTGSGKTVAFLLPCFNVLLKDGIQKRPRGRAPVVLVLAPTRELACQIEQQAKAFGKPAGLATVCCYGGSPKFHQIRDLEDGCDVLVATPGRLKDLYAMGKVVLKNVKMIILDEADRMLDMGFEPQIRAIIAECPASHQRQTLMFTATWPKGVQKMASSFLTNPITISMGDSGELHANKNITQKVFLVDAHDKEEQLLKLLAEIKGENTNVYQFPKTIIFCGMKSSVQGLADKLWSSGMAVDSLHGDKEQWQRSKVIDAFKTSSGQQSLRLLVATDVAARGLDVKDVVNVINFDFPGGKAGVEDYVHRIGRTGRAGAEGASYTFFDPRKDAQSAEQLVDVMKRAGQPVPAELQSLSQHAGGRGGRHGGFRNGGNRSQGGGRFQKRW